MKEIAEKIGILYDYLHYINTWELSADNWPKTNLNYHFSAFLVQIQWKQRTERDESIPKQAKTISSAGKVNATVFWDFQEIIFIDYLKFGRIKVRKPHLIKINVIQSEWCLNPTSWQLRWGNCTKDDEFQSIEHETFSPGLASSISLPNSRETVGWKEILMVFWNYQNFKLIFIRFKFFCKIKSFL